MEIPEQGVVAVVGAALGGGATLWARNHKTDKVDAVMAIAQAFDRVAQAQDKIAERNAAFTDDLQKQVQLAREEIVHLNRELRKRDELVFELMSGRRKLDGLDRTGTGRRALDSRTDAEEPSGGIPERRSS